MEKRFVATTIFQFRKMCGILGIIPTTSRQLFNLALTTIAHRGPDGSGIWNDNESVMLGHRRLSILDTTDAASQPMHRHGRYTVVFNGEIYNFLEIRLELEGAGERFTTDSDTEVLLAAYARWGEGCLTRFNGMWAFAIWDSTEHHLFIARDRMGEKPLFFVEDSSRFIFASEQKALLPFIKNLRPSKNFHSLARNSYCYESTRETLFDGILRFPAAHYGVYKDGKLLLKRYWAPLDKPQHLPTNYNEQVEALRELLIDSCKLRLRSDVPVATGLSGGVDSSAIAACISEVGRKRSGKRLPKDWQNAFVASFPGTVMDEAQAAQSIASHLGIHLWNVSVTPEVATDDLENLAYLFEEIHEVNPLPHFQLYRSMRNKGVLVSLDGHGGDELFCGYESSVLHALPTALLSSSNVRLLLNTYTSLHPKNSQFRAMTPLRIAAYLARYEMRHLRSRLRRDSAMSDALAKCDSLNRHLFSLSFETVLPTLLRNYDRYSMMSGVEIRSPLLDHRIVDFAFALNWKSKLHNGYTKSILRDAVAPFLPEPTIRNRTKIGFAPPIIDWLRGPLRDYILDEIHSHSFQRSELIDPIRVGVALSELVNGNSSLTLYAAERIWKEFATYLWEKVFFNVKPWSKLSAN